MNHSEKALKTLSLMNTQADDWGLTPIQWVWELLKMPVEERCPDCYGRGRAYVYPDRTLFNRKTDKRFLKLGKDPGHYVTEDFKKKHGIEYGRCPTCPQRRVAKEVGTGKVIVFKKIKVLVGYPQWAKKTVFDSRFHGQVCYRPDTASGKSVKHVCELCSKSITGRWSRVVPVNAKGEDGVIHGMWVGADCAKKFLGVEIVFDEKQFEGIKKSEIQRHYIIKMEAS